MFYWLELLADFACVERSNFDVAYLSEIDPLWQDDELSYLINPEAALFANPIAQAACAADCTSVTTTGRNIPGLFWCAGCHGTVYPMNGNIQADNSRIQGGLLAAERMTTALGQQAGHHRHGHWPRREAVGRRRVDGGFCFFAGTGDLLCNPCDRTETRAESLRGADWDVRWL